MNREGLHMAITLLQSRSRGYRYNRRVTQRPCNLLTLIKVKAAAVHVSRTEQRGDFLVRWAQTGLRARNEYP